MAERVRNCDIAEELGLSTATVSNVIHGKTGKVSAETAERVTALLEEREYIPSMAGIRVPEDISVAGFDDTPICEMLRPALTTVRQDGALRARLAVEKLRELKEGRPVEAEIMLPGFAGGAKQHRAAQRIILHKRGAFILYSVMRLTFASLLPGNYNKEEKREVRYDMKGQSAFFKAVCALAVPAALQSMLQSSFSMVDQIMIGQLGVSPAVFRRRRWMDRLGSAE